MFALCIAVALHDDRSLRLLSLREERDKEIQRERYRDWVRKERDRNLREKGETKEIKICTCNGKRRFYRKFKGLGLESQN